jgi:hypothetical protein
LQEAPWSGITEILPLLDWNAKLSSWRQITDILLSASSELWRSRDYSRHLLLNIGGVNHPERTTSLQDQLQQDMDKAYDWSKRLAPSKRVASESIQFTALRRALHLLVQKGGGLLVLEGQLNPHADSPESRLLQARLDASLRNFSKEEGFTYLSIADQGIQHPDFEWSDLTHLNETGQQRLTGFLINYLRQNPFCMPDMQDSEM